LNVVLVRRKVTRYAGSAVLARCAWSACVRVCVLMEGMRGCTVNARTRTFGLLSVGDDKEGLRAPYTLVP